MDSLNEIYLVFQEINLPIFSVSFWFLGKNDFYLILILIDQPK